MSWENFELPDENTTQLVDLSLANTRVTRIQANNVAQYLTLGDNFAQYFNPNEPYTTLYEQSGLKVVAEHLNVAVYINNSLIFGQATTESSNILSDAFVGFGFVVDHSTERANVIFVSTVHSGSTLTNYDCYTGINYISDLNKAELYQVLMSITPSYNWQSVPTISGKNGILSLATLNDVNNGEEITTNDNTKYNINDDNNVQQIVTKIINNW